MVWLQSGFKKDESSSLRAEAEISKPLSTIANLALEAELPWVLYATAWMWVAPVALTAEGMVTESGLPMTVFNLLTRTTPEV